MNNREVGNTGEKIAKEYLIEQDFKILERNYRTRFGEIDLIAAKNERIVFVEVKSRNSLNYGYPSEAVNQKKKNKIISTAKHYIMMNELRNMDFRFDVIEVYLKDENIHHIENAFLGN